MTTTLITGASSGIGKELANLCAARGDDLVLVARRSTLLDDLSSDLSGRFGITATGIPLDLSHPDAAATLDNLLTQEGFEIDVLFNNAGFATHGDVSASDPDRLTDEIAVNCQALVGTTARLLPQMISRRSGTIVNIASTAAFQPVPHMATYAASKAFVLSFTESLWAEVKDQGIRVLAVCPGSTDTEFFDHAGDAAVVGKKRTPHDVAQLILANLDGKNPSIVDGYGNRIVARLITRLLPKRLILRLAGRSVS